MARCWARCFASFTALSMMACRAAVLAPPEIPYQSTIRTVTNWGDDIVVITQEWLPYEHKWRHSLGRVEKDAVRPLVFPELDCKSYDDVAETRLAGRLLACSAGHTSRAYGVKAGVWKALTSSLPGDDFRIAADDKRIALVGKESAYILADPDSRRIRRLSLNIDRRIRLNAPSAVLLQGNTLLVAFDAGEFGGGLFRFDLSQRNQKPRSVVLDNVRALALDASGAIWVAAGVSHLALTGGALYRLKGNEVRVVAKNEGGELQTQDQDPSTTEQTGLRFPGLTEVVSVTIGQGDRPIVLLPDFGLFVVESDGFHALLEMPLQFSYEVPGRIESGYPTGFTMSPSGDIYVGTDGLGVIALRKRGERYDSAQLLFQPNAQR